MPTPAYADGSMQFGSQTVIIGGQSYDLKNIKVKRGRRKIVQPDIGGKPKQKVHIETLQEGSATAQFGASTQVEVPQDAVFTLVKIGGTGTRNFIIEDVEDAYEIEGETYNEITFSVKLT